MYPHLPTLLFALSAISVHAHPSSPHSRDAPGLSLTAKDPTDTTCTGPNNGNDVSLSHGHCVIYQPAAGSNIYVDFGDDTLWESQIEVFSDTGCETPLFTLAPTEAMIGNHESTMCAAMNADWPAWQSVKRGKLVYDTSSGLGGLKRE